MRNLALVLVVLVAALTPASVAGAQTPSLPRVGSVPLDVPATALAAGDGHLIVGSGTRVLVVDVLRPEAPAPAGTYEFAQPVLGLAAAGRALYVANSHDGLRRLDLTNPSAPTLTGTSATRGQAAGVAAAGALVFVSDNSLGFDVVEGAGAAAGRDRELARAGRFERVGEYLGDGFPRGVAAGGGLVFVADQPAGLIVVDVSDPGAPAEAGRLSLGRDPVLGVVAPDERSTGGAPPAVVAVVSGRGGLQAVDVSDPAAPRVTAAVPAAGRPAGAAMWGRTLYAAGAGVLEVFDLTDPGRPVLAGRSGLGGAAGPLAVNVELVFAATSGEVVLFRRPGNEGVVRR